jgi:conjugal transfer pilus assembly protein TraK
MKRPRRKDVREETKAMCRAITLLLSVLCISLPAWSETEQKGMELTTDSVTVLPEVTTRVLMSSSDINRIVCPIEIKDVIYSKEKGVVVRISGRNAFVKFMITQKNNGDSGQEMTYSSTPSELYVVCGGDIYTIIAVPERIPARTISLSSGRLSRIRENASFFSGPPFEKKVIKLIKTVYTDAIPESFTVKRIGKRVDGYADIALALQRIVLVDGEGLQVKEYAATITGDLETRELREKDFLRTRITKRPIAISLDTHRLEKGETARIFIVEQKENEEEL